MSLSASKLERKTNRISISEHEMAYNENIRTVALTLILHPLIILYVLSLSDMNDVVGIYKERAT